MNHAQVFMIWLFGVIGGFGLAGAVIGVLGFVTGMASTANDRYEARSVIIIGATAAAASIAIIVAGLR